MNKLRNRTGISLDMTPLLDVIFIVLMVVLCHQTMDAQTTQQDLKQLTNQRDEAVAENEMHESQLHAYEDANNLVAYITLRADYATQDPKTRHIQLAYNDSVAFEEITITPETAERGYTLFENNMKQFLNEKKDMPVLIVLNEDHILYRDQMEISRILGELDEQYTNLYLTGKKV